MNTTIFQVIDALHSEWSSMDKAYRLRWLTGAKMQLNQFAQYISLKGRSMSDVERNYAHKLLKKIN